MTILRECPGFSPVRAIALLLAHDPAWCLDRLREWKAKIGAKGPGLLTFMICDRAEYLAWRESLEARAAAAAAKRRAAIEHERAEAAERAAQAARDGEVARRLAAMADGERETLRAGLLAAMLGDWWRERMRGVPLDDPRWRMHGLDEALGITIDAKEFLSRDGFGSPQPIAGPSLFAVDDHAARHAARGMASTAAVSVGVGDDRGGLEAR